MGAANPVPATALTDVGWMRERLDLARTLYGPAPAHVLGTVWWYSASSVLVAPTVESLVLARVPLDPGLDAVDLHILADGRLPGARSDRLFEGDLAALGAAFRAALEPAIDQVAAVTGARARALWAVAADSIAARLLWAGSAVGDVGRATALAGPLADGIGPIMPSPRYITVGPHLVVRRVSCCLIDKATGQEKCTSCPNQHPGVRERRIRAALG
ncbi:MAG: (2Fe-2S)-binding protein [Pseudonocardiaceae bacterium]